ncbi:TetR/AcrR family transcriptional regulator [Conexibacter woesei]|uniref:Transcriptional regulator, TetR family n=1 Tax=Conexibacter woesei (strain DSM 14684 / CCUG 47730 / CIP 108061 / JCM 11494 / NBRC 100937 / ID131577) TaxID=469383 RepID=D3EZ29_CONWI|nr:TetR/AcrR family transcriptional regulator [Conexibacter woesei]ADB49903.1 transcriptional regulator, TetR family [Conexibacter woesei DSM 14684]
MAPPRKHSTDDILDAARALVLAEGPRAASVAAISQASGAPVGTLYHRFGNRDGVLAAAWLRALERFQAGALAAAAAHPADPVEAGVAMAVASLSFARDHPGDARLLLVVRRDDLLDGAGPGAGAGRGDGAGSGGGADAGRGGGAGPLREQLDAMNAPLHEAIVRIARALHGRADARALDGVTRAVVDLPTAVVRRHLRDDAADAAGAAAAGAAGPAPLPRWLAADVAADVRALLARGR